MTLRSAHRAAPASVSSRVRAAASVVAALGVSMASAACEEEEDPTPQRSLDQPNAMEFACYGDLRLVDEGQEPSPDDPVVSSAQPLSSCELRAEGEVPAGQESLEGSEISEPGLFALALQRTRGTVAVIDSETEEVRDSDPLTPGKSAIPIGTLPVDLARDASGCYVTSANGGSCDLSHLDVTSAIDPDESPEVNRVAVVNASDEAIRAKPRAIAGPAEGGPVGRACPEEPEGVAYVAYPQCNAVAAVDLATGNIVGGLRFGEEGGAEITGGDISCAAECSGGSVRPDPASLFAAFAEGGPPRPAALQVSEEGGELYVGADNSSSIWRVTLDADGVPEDVAAIDLEGDAGVVELAVSDVINMGGDSGELGGTGHEAQFLYAVASDRTVRVVDLLRDIECDTQVDPRELHDERDVSFLSCMPAGDPATPPRREGARSPGIHLPNEEVPLDVAFATLDEAQEAPPSPVNMVGHFAFITATSGRTYVANVDDDNYPDFENEEEPRLTFLELALPHRLRDLVPRREELPTTCGDTTGDPFQLAPRLVSDIDQNFRSDRLASEKTHLLPTLKNVECAVEGEDDTPPVSELSFRADAQTRERAFPDLGRLKNDRWRVSWEGVIPAGRDGSGNVFAGSLDAEGEGVAIEDGASRFCSLGVKPYDIAQIRGCNPADGSVCGPNKECVSHPDQPEEVERGLCVPTGSAEAFQDACREVLLTEGRYSVEETYADRLVLGERRRVLGTSPLEGCESDAQCTELAAYERDLADEAHPLEEEEGNGEDEEDPEFAWECAEDPSRAPGPDRCQMVCESNDDCEAGTVCSGGFCVEGALPPQECSTGIEHFQLRVGDAYAVVGEREGFLHSRVADSESGECIEDPEAHPLAVGRIPLDVPECASPAIDSLIPNPCQDRVDQVEVHQEYEAGEEQCVSGDEIQRVREAPAIRFRNPALTFHLVDYRTQGDALCIGDREGERPAHSAAFAAPELSFEIGGGLVEMFALSEEDVTFARRVEQGPLGQIWVLDEGEASDSLRGQVLRFDPGTADEEFDTTTLR